MQRTSIQKTHREKASKKKRVEAWYGVHLLKLKIACGCESVCVGVGMCGLRGRMTFSFAWRLHSPDRRIGKISTSTRNVSLWNGNDLVILLLVQAVNALQRLAPPVKKIGSARQFAELQLIHEAVEVVIAVRCPAIMSRCFI